MRQLPPQLLVRPCSLSGIASVGRPVRPCHVRFCMAGNCSYQKQAESALMRSYPQNNHWKGGWRCASMRARKVQRGGVGAGPIGLVRKRLLQSDSIADILRCYDRHLSAMADKMRERPRRRPLVSEAAEAYAYL
jgi:hypothetical protein